jgi:hypothetical protein
MMVRFSVLFCIAVSIGMPQAETFTYQNPNSFPEEIRDPCIIKDGGLYYIVYTVWPFTHHVDKDPEKPDYNSSPGIKLWSSPDLENWTFENWLVKSSELPDTCAYKHRFWAPEIVKLGGRFYLVFTADNWIDESYNHEGSNGLFAFVGVADVVTGPYEHITYLKDGRCDTHLFEAYDGRTYAALPEGNMSVQEIDLSRIDEGVISYIGPRIKAYDCDNSDIGMSDSPDYLEGPWVIRSNGKYIMLNASPYNESSSGYWAGAAYANDPMGPWTKDPRGKVFWGGHMAVFEGPDGGHWFCYRGEEHRETWGRLCIDPFSIAPDGTIQCDGPTNMEQIITYTAVATFTPGPGAGNQGNNASTSWDIIPALSDIFPVARYGIYNIRGRRYFASAVIRPGILLYQH